MQLFFFDMYKTFVQKFFKYFLYISTGMKKYTNKILHHHFHISRMNYRRYNNGILFEINTEFFGISLTPVRTIAHSFPQKF